ncbi:MAG: PDZ domain-containing protein [Actinobacteria bacterium]|nr:MAG: PDZ domain-containing protein [Actinomycetota bacterium]
MTALAELETTIQTAAEKVGPAVVGLGRGWGLGTGVVVAAGRVLTNAHNLRGDEATVTFAGGRRETGRVAGVDLDVDLAAIEVDTGDVEPVAWDPEAGPPALGTAVLALANPGGRGLRVTTGFVSSAERRFRGPRGRRIAGAIEHTAPLPRGSSGGPLVDSEGRLLGLNTIRQEGGLILAIPADAGLARRADALWRGEPAQRARLGVAIAPPRVARRLRKAVGLPERDGLLVRAVEDDSPAGRAGVQPGDLVVAVDRRPVEGVDVLYEVLDAGPDQVRLTLVRGEQERDVEVALTGAEAA